LTTPVSIALRLLLILRGFGPTMACPAVVLILFRSLKPAPG